MIARARTRLIVTEASMVCTGDFLDMDSAQRSLVVPPAKSALGLCSRTVEATEGRNAFVEARAIDVSTLGK